MPDDRAPALVRQILAGHTGRFAELIENYQKPVYNLALRMTGSSADAADLAQDIFVRAWLNLDKYNPRRKFFTWLYTLALHLIRNHLQKKARFNLFGTTLTASQQFEQSAPIDPAQALALKEDEAQLQQLLLRLPLAQREALLLRFFKDIPYDDIAVILNISVSGAKMRVQRGLAAMRQMLGSEGL